MFISVSYWIGEFLRLNVGEFLRLNVESYGLFRIIVKNIQKDN